MEKIKVNLQEIRNPNCVCTLQQGFKMLEIKAGILIREETKGLWLFLDITTHFSP